MAERLSKAKLSVFRRLGRKKHRIAENRYLIEGWHLLGECLEAKARLLAVIYDPSRSLSEEDEKVLRAAKDRAKRYTWLATISCERSGKRRRARESSA